MTERADRAMAAPTDLVPESNTMPVVRPEAYRDSTAWMATYMAGTLNFSNMIWVIFSRLALGLRGASVRIVLAI